MVEFKLVIGDPKTGKCIQKTIADQATKSLVGLKVGETLKGELIDMAGYEFLITGGSDYCGIPMRKGISGDRKNILIEKSVGFRSSRRGMKKRKNVCGEMINDKTSQINLKITKYGAKKIDEGAKEEGKEQEAPKEQKTETKEEKIQEKQKEEKTAEKKE